MRREKYKTNESFKSRAYGYLFLRLWSILLTFIFSHLTAVSQESTTSYNFLRLPVSAHVAAVGGDSHLP